jgi:PIN like domain
MQIEAGDTHFAPNAPDTEWLPIVGQRGWVLLTKDKAIRTNALERKALISHQAAAFMLGGGNQPGAEMARIFVESRRRMERALRRFDVPLIASIFAKLPRERTLGRRRLVEQAQRAEVTHATRVRFGVGL